MRLDHANYFSGESVVCVGRDREVEAEQGEVVTPATTPWLSCVIPVPRPSWRLICLPHAGGSASFFNGWGLGLPEVEVHTACYPGRGRRLSEPPPNDLIALAVEIAAHIEPLCDVPVVLFG